MAETEKVAIKGAEDIPGVVGGTEGVVVAGGVVDLKLRGQVMDFETTVMLRRVPMLQNRNVPTNHEGAVAGVVDMEGAGLQTAKTALTTTNSRRHHRL